MKPHLLAFAVSLLAGAILCNTVRCQCPLSWSSAAPEAELSGVALCSTLWDPDGAGPLPQRLVVGGDNLVGGTAVAGRRVMTWDGSQWQPLANVPGTTGQVTALTTWGGLLVAAGSFTGGGTDHLALWNGSAWQPLGAGLGTVPQAIAEWNGNLVAAVGPNVIIKLWNGSTWSTLPTPPSITLVRAMVSIQGLLCIGGNGSGSTNGALERWNGTTWLTTVPANGRIRALGVRAFQFNSSLYVGGEFSTIGTGGTPAQRVASASSASSPVWLAVGNGLGGGDCAAMHVRATSALGVAVVVRTTSGTSGSGTAGVMQLSGTSFVSMGTATPTSLSYYGGSYHGTSPGPTINSAACQRYDGTNWVPVLGHSIDGDVSALVRSGSDVIVGGTIQATSGATLNRIARWDGTTFHPLGTGMTGTSVDALTTQANGDVVAGGLFTMAGGVFTSNVARWNGTAWSPLGSGTDQQVLALCRMPNGDVVAGGKFTTAGGVACSRIARWNGSAWSPLGFGMNGDVMALAVRSDGTLFAGGAFTIAGTASCNHIAQWNGSAWSPLGFGVNGDVHALAVRPNDDVVMAGAFTTVIGLLTDRCVRWTGSTWAGMNAASADPSPVRALFALPNGDVVAGRGFHQLGASPDAGISRWSGSGWSGFDTGLASSVPGTAVAVRSLAQRADGALVVGGDFEIADDLVAHGLAKLSPTCPASSTPYGAGCSGTTGPLTISADTLPWIGATFRTTTTAVAPGALCLSTIGLTQLSIPLALLLGEGQPGCFLLASLDILLFATNGPGDTASTSFAFSNDPALIGVPFFQQVLPLEFDGSGALAAVRASNALAATIGTL